MRQSAPGPEATASAPASSSTGCRRGRIGGVTIQLRPARFSRGMTPARSSEDLPDPDDPEQRDQLGAALGAPRFEPLDQAADVVVAAEIDRGVLFLEGEQTRKRRAAGIPCEAALGVERDPHQFAREPLEPALAIAQSD